jgi:hypothetical protein
LGIDLIAILITSFIEVTFLGSILYFLGSILYRMYYKMSADDAALYLQGRRIEEILKEMRRDPANPR